MKHYLTRRTLGEGKDIPAGLKTGAELGQSQVRRQRWLPVGVGNPAIALGA